MLKVGITGGIGSGKSTVTKMLRDKGFSIIDADIVATEVFIIYPEIVNKIKEEFGHEFFGDGDKLDRKKLGKYIFKSANLRKKLESIMMPFIIIEIQRRIKMCEEKKVQICFLDAPTLIENNLHTSMDVTILVWVSSSIQVQRVMFRDDLDVDETMDIIRAQMTIEEKKEFADFIIDNEGSIENTRMQLDTIITQLERLNVKL